MALWVAFEANFEHFGLLPGRSKTLPALELRLAERLRDRELLDEA